MKLIGTLAILGVAAVSCAHVSAADGKAEATTVLNSESSWNGEPYVSYPPGRPKLTVLKILLPPHTKLPWHSHSVPNAAYVVSGYMTIEDKATGKKKVIKAGEAFAESVGMIHRGVTDDVAAEVIVTYAATEQTPLSTPAEGEKHEFGE